jgi:hypothetical protein
MIYHITHVDRLSTIAIEGNLLADRVMSERGDPTLVIGMQSIKTRRLTLPVRCHPGDCVGDYVPFYFCPRSVMLYVIHRANHPELTYRGGEEPIVHLEADLHEVIAWAEANAQRWAFTLSNAGASYAEFRSDVNELEQLNWLAIGANDWRDPDVREGKQAEFLLHGAFPLSLVRRIGVKTEATRERVNVALATVPDRPPIDIVPNWYY